MQILILEFQIKFETKIYSEIQSVKIDLIYR